MKRTIAWFVGNPVATNLLMTILIVSGLISVFQIRQEDLPPIKLDVVLVTVPYLGAAPEEVESGVSVRIEEALEGVQGIHRVTSTSSEGVAYVGAELEAGASLAQVANEIQSRVDAISTFPAETERPVVSLVAPINDGVEIAISGDADERTLKELALEMREEIVAMNGISSVEVAYVRADEISIEVSEQTLRRMGLTFDQVANAVRNTSLDMPGGSIRTGAGEVLLRTRGQAYTADDLKDVVVVSGEDGTRVYLEEIAAIGDGFQEGETRARFDGKPAAIVRVNQVGDEDLVEISARVRAYAEEARARMPDGIAVTIWRDESETLRDRIDILLGASFTGLALVLLLLSLPLQFRVAMWVAAGIPIAILGTIAVFGPLDITISTLVVVAFILALGIVVDDAIVVGERIYAHEIQGKDRFAAAVEGTAEVAVPVIFGVLTTIAAFTPLMFAPGNLGQLLSVIGYVVAICLVFSLIESQLILPAHLAHRKQPSAKGGVNAASRLWLRFQQQVASGLERFTHEWYGPALERVIEWRHTALAIGLSILLLALGLILGGRIQVQFLPAFEGDNIIAQLEMPEGADVDQTARAARQIEAAALALKAELDAAHPGRPSLIRHLFTSVGQSLGGRFRDRPQSHVAEVALSILPLSERGDISVTAMTGRWRELAGPIYDSVSLTFSTTGLTVGDAISIRLQGRNVDDLARAAAELRGELARFDGVRDISDSFRSGKQEARLSLRPEGRQLGLTLNDLARQARQAFYGEEVQRVQRGAEDVRVMVRYPQAERRSLGDLENMRIRAGDGAEIPFAAVADIELGRGYSEITRVNRQRVVTVRADVDREAVTPEAVLRSLEDGALPEILSRYRGISYSLAGEQEEQNESVTGLINFIPVALLLIYALLAIPLRSYLQPLLIMSVIPFGAVGAIIGHIVMGEQFIITSIFGLIALAGVAVNSSLVLVDYVNRQRRAGVALRVAVHRACIVRFRPILITSATTFAGLMPLMLNDNPATFFFVPMAISLGWGVLFATVNTWLLLPCLYMILEDARSTKPALAQHAA
ncbi:MAG: efflux RND transporter permease subunit [Gammaproteobacteria bacterium]|nr:efflux RND transporter permease subunit [Gammaproteobacteria bacterium]MYD01205.1 efflux RND transporter permease subunit [Gammaproteobacteria bacterium]MYI25052.1 efflux RND transporter permease subunit [Gammaproteobacteria bacterium]